MADLSNVGLDANVPENTGEFEVLPAGHYNLVIINDEVKNNKKGNGKLLTLKLQVTAGSYTGTTIQDVINLTNPSVTCAQIGQGTLKRVCGLCSIPYPPTDTTGLHGKPMRCKVGVKSFTSNTTGNELQSNKILSYGSVQAATQEPPLAGPPGETVENAW